MNRTLPSGSMSSIDQFVRLAANKLRKLFFIGFLLMGSLTYANAQAAGNEVIKGWNNLEEADFLFDVYYQIVKCNPVGSPEVHLWAFNEGGNVDAIGFTLTLKDEDGSEVTQEIEKFEIGPGQSFKTDCSNNDYPYLKFTLPEEIDVETMSIEIIYNK